MTTGAAQAETEAADKGLPDEEPAAATLVREDDFELDATHGLLPKLFEFAPGAYATRGGLYDFNFNVRGFNSVANRRVKVLIDGRDPSMAFFGSQEWAASSLPLDLVRAELVRGPSAADHGAGAASGVVDLVTRDLKDAAGGRLRIRGGERDSAGLDATWSPRVSQRWYAKLLAGGRRGRGFSEPRTDRAEYSELCDASARSDCLPREAVSFDPDEDEEVTFGSVRLDRYPVDGARLSLELGTTEVEGPVLATGLGRLRVSDAITRWSRFRYDSPHWTILSTYNNREAGRQRVLSTGDNLAFDDRTWNVEVSTRWGLFSDRALLTAGLSHEDEKVDSLDSQGPLRPTMLNPLNRQTALFEPVTSETDGVFARLDWDLGERLRLLAAARYDDSSLHEPRFSPNVSLAYAPGNGHTLRLTYHEGFVVPNYAELFLRHDVEAARNLAHLEPICALDGVACGFDVDFLAGEDPTQDATPDTRVLAVGRADLGLEETRTWEIGYSGSFGNKIRLALDYHTSEHESFITDLLPQLGTSLGRVNPSFGAYTPPEDLSAARRAELFAGLAAALGPDLVLLSNDVDGTPILVLSSYTNLGRVDSQGVDFDLGWELAEGWSLGFTYSWFDVDVKEGAPGLEDQLLPNTPENRASFELGYAAEPWRAQLRARWFDDFRWASGPFVGNVESSSVVDLTFNVRLADHWDAGLYVANLLDEDHFESFGGDLLARRALASLSFDW